MNLSDLILAGDHLPTINIANINLGTVEEDSEEGIIDMPGLMAFYEGKGLTNESMSSNPVWKDLSTPPLSRDLSPVCPLSQYIQNRIQPADSLHVPVHFRPGRQLKNHFVTF